MKIFESLIRQWKIWRGDLIPVSKLTETIARAIIGTFLKILGRKIEVVMTILTEQEAEIFVRFKGVACTIEIACFPDEELEGVIKWMVTSGSMVSEDARPLEETTIAIADICEHFGVPRETSMKIQGQM